MNKEKLNQFHCEFKALQEKYGIRVFADYEERIDYNWDETAYVSGVESYLSLYDKNDKKLAIIDWENDLIEVEKHE